LYIVFRLEKYQIDGQLGAASECEPWGGDGRAVTRPQITARFVLLFINAGLSYRVIEDEQLRLAVDLGRVANAKVLADKIHVLRGHVDTRMRQKVSHLKCVNIEDDGSTDKGKRRMYRFVAHGIKQHVVGCREPAFCPVGERAGT
jgi:hypothetical protein